MEANCPSFWPQRRGKTNVHEMHANLEVVKVWGKKKNLKIVLDIQRWQAGGLHSLKSNDFTESSLIEVMIARLVVFSHHTIRSVTRSINDDEESDQTLVAKCEGRWWPRLVNVSTSKAIHRGLHHYSLLQYWLSGGQLQWNFITRRSHRRLTYDFLQFSADRYFFKILYIYFLFEWVVTEHAVSELPGSFRRSAYYIMC